MNKILLEKYSKLQNTIVYMEMKIVIILDKNVLKAITIRRVRVGNCLRIKVSAKFLAF